MASTNNAPTFIIIKLSIILVVSILLSLAVGAYSLSLTEIIAVLADLFHFGDRTVDPSSSFLLLNIRLPRILLALIVGAGLAISGAAVQVVFRNPLAEPGLIGVSSGAMLAAVCFIVLKSHLPFDIGVWGDALGLSAAAFLGGLGATMLVYQLSTQDGRTHIGTMLLAGIAIAALAGGLTGILIFYADDAQLRDITFWNFGSVSGANWTLVGSLGAVIFIGSYQIMTYAKQLEIMQLGSDEASYLGVNVEKTKRVIVLWVVLMVGTCVAFTGLINFIGLVVPHLVRIYYKNTSFVHTVIYTGFIGAMLLGCADMIARTIVAPAELPIGILTSLMGAPFFLWLLINNKNKY